MKNNQPLTIVGDGSQKRDFSHIDDIIDANILAFSKDLDFSHFGQVYNVASGTNYSINEIASMISDSVVYIPARIGEAKETLSNINKIQSVFGWKSKTSIEDWISKNIT